MVEQDVAEGPEGLPRQGKVLRVLTAMSWCGRSSGWQKKMARDTVRRTSNNNRVFPSDDEGSGSGSSNPSPKLEKPVPNVLDRSDESTEQYKLFCPICMYYYAETFRTMCCNHHICTNCSQEILWSHRKEACEINETSMQELTCPHCNSESLSIQRITRLDDYRHYDDSPGATNSYKGRIFNAGHGSNLITPSPLKIGDTYENMMKKMLTYDQCGINITAGAPPDTVPEACEDFELPGAPVQPSSDNANSSLNGLDSSPHSSMNTSSGALHTSSNHSRSIVLVDDSLIEERRSIRRIEISPIQVPDPQSNLSVEHSPRNGSIRRSDISSMHIPPELQRPPINGRPPRPAGLDSSRAISTSRASSPALMERPPSPVTPGPNRLLPPLEPPMQVPSPGRAQMYLIGDASA